MIPNPPRPGPSGACKSSWDFLVLSHACGVSTRAVGTLSARLGKRRYEEQRWAVGKVEKTIFSREELEPAGAAGTRKTLAEAAPLGNH